MDFEYVEYTKELKELLENAFTDAFMQENSNFEDFKSFQFSSAVFVTWNSDQLIYSKSLFDGFVAESTNFKSWEVMVKKGMELYFKSKNDILNDGN
jgi:hypothetical protein